MPTLIDETGNTYGYLTVLYRVQQDRGKPTKWHCKCKCGNELDVLGCSLRNGNTKSCGCYQQEQAALSNIKRSGESLVNKHFGSLTVLEDLGLRPAGNRRITFYKCKCDCGTLCEKSRSYLKSSPHPSCGCYSPTPVNFINEVGNKYGKLTVLSRYGYNSDNRILWLCQCECGNTKIASGKSLRAGFVLSCGCLHSQGERRVAQILTELNIQFERQKTFDDLKSLKNYPLYFDFYLPDYNLCIEYQGEQHFHPILHGYYTQKKWDELQIRDTLKRKYCQMNNIKLIEIPYTDYSKLDSNYIKEVMNFEYHSY